jgi:hypothetical protein
LAVERPTFLLQTARDTPHTRFWRHHDALPHHTSQKNACGKPWHSLISVSLRNSGPVGIPTLFKPTGIDLEEARQFTVSQTGEPHVFGCCAFCKRYANSESIGPKMVAGRQYKVVG